MNTKYQTTLNIFIMSVLTAWRITVVITISISISIISLNWIPEIILGVYG